MEKHKDAVGSRFGRTSFRVLSILFVICIIVQIFLAGLAIFVDPSNWRNHKIFVHLFELIPILMFIFAFVGQLPRWAKWQSAAMFGLIFVMYLTANITPVFPWAAAAHPIIAMFLFMGSIQIAKQSFQLAKSRKGGE